MFFRQKRCINFLRSLKKSQNEKNEIKNSFTNDFFNEMKNSFWRSFFFLKLLAGYFFLNFLKLFLKNLFEDFVFFNIAFRSWSCWERHVLWHHDALAGLELEMGMVVVAVAAAVAGVAFLLIKKFNKILKIKNFQMTHRLAASFACPAHPR